MKGTDLANRLLQNIQSSLKLRSQIPYLDMLRELKQGGMYITPEMLNTSSNFGSFDRALKEVLDMLNHQNPIFMPAPSSSPLPLTLVYENLSANIMILAELLQSAIIVRDNDTGMLVTPSELLLNRLETINLAAI